MVSVIFPAAGMGKRMGAKGNKIFLKLKDEPIFLHALRTFSRVEEVAELIIAVRDGEQREMEALLAGEMLKKWKIVCGGKERQYSIENALREIDEAAEIVLVHDAARPLVRKETVEAVIAAARKHGGAIAAVPEKCTVKMVDEDGFVIETPPREKIWEVQTPQGFARDIILRAYEKARADNFLGTDDASLVERMGGRVQVVLSDYANIKVTTREDLPIAEALLQREREKQDDT